jgi:hypothetical protein
MKDRSRISIDLRSQDLKTADMERFRAAAIGLRSKRGEDDPQELIMFSVSAKPYQYPSLDAFKKESISIPDDANYFYYTITFPTGNRFALYLDPDRPAKMVIEGDKEFINLNKERMMQCFPKGGKRYLAQGKLGMFFIWGAVVFIALSVIGMYSVLSSPNPYLILWVIFISSLLGIYMSMAKSKVINPANTMSLGRKRKHPLIDLMLHFITIALGIISVVLVILFIEYNM